MKEFFELPPEDAPIGEAPAVNHVEFHVTRIDPVDEAGRDAIREEAHDMGYVGRKPAIKITSPTLEATSSVMVEGRQVAIGALTLSKARKRSILPH